MRQFAAPIDVQVSGFKSSVNRLRTRLRDEAQRAGVQLGEFASLLP